MIRPRFGLMLLVLSFLTACTGSADSKDVSVTDVRADQSVQPPEDSLTDRSVNDLGPDSETASDTADTWVDSAIPGDQQETQHPDVAQDSIQDLPQDHLGDLSDTAQPDADADVAGDGADLGPDVLSVPLPGFGTLTGECGVLDETELLSPQPFLFVNQLDFGATPFTGDLDVLSPGAQEVLTDGNAGGSSSLSETFSFDVLYRCELATLVKTENEVIYTTPGKMTDILVEVDGVKLGVSVSRAFIMNCATSYSLDSAKSLLDKKLKGIQASSALVAPEDAWQKQILHLLTCGPEHLALVKQAWDELLASPEAAAVVGDTIVIVTVTEGADAFIYEE